MTYELRHQHYKYRFFLGLFPDGHKQEILLLDQEQN